MPWIEAAGNAGNKEDQVNGPHGKQGGAECKKPAEASFNSLQSIHLSPVLSARCARFLEFPRPCYLRGAFQLRYELLLTLHILDLRNFMRKSNVL